MKRGGFLPEARNAVGLEPGVDPELNPNRFREWIGDVMTLQVDIGQVPVWQSMLKFFTRTEVMLYLFPTLFQLSFLSDLFNMSLWDQMTP